MNVMEVVRVVRKIPLPISHITVEDVQVDVRRLSNPNVRGSEYQQSNRLDENLRIACLMRDNFTRGAMQRFVARLPLSEMR